IGISRVELELPQVSPGACEWIERFHKFLQLCSTLFGHVGELDSISKCGMIAHDHAFCHYLLLAEPKRDLHFLRNLLRGAHLHITATQANVAGLSAYGRARSRLA